MSKISAICPFLLFRKSSLKALFIICTLSSISALGVLVLATPQLNQTSAKNLTQYLKTIIQPQDEVITYFKYYQDIPFYLEKRVTIVADWQDPAIPLKDNWLREIWLGKTSKTNWLVDEKSFWQQFNSKKRVFVFLNANYLTQFELHTNKYFYLKKDNDIILLSNQPNPNKKSIVYYKQK